MTMELVETTVNTTGNWKPMNRMKNGEVAIVKDTSIVVLCVPNVNNEAVFLILDDHDDTDSYGHDCDTPVRLLSSHERVTITFSN
jgi:hypothetical protein